MLTNELSVLRNEFLNFAQWHTHRSPMYHFLATCVAECYELLGLAAFSRAGQTQPALFFAAIQSILHKKPETELARYYPNFSGRTFSEEDTMSAFRDFCFEHISEIQSLMATQIAQSSDVQRSTLVVAGLSRMQQLTNGQSFHLVEVGCPTGLLLNYDYYAYDFSGFSSGFQFGDSTSPVRFSCELRNRPAFELVVPTAKTKVGIDPHPVDLLDSEQADWSRSFIPADQPLKVTQFNRAVEVMRMHPLNMIRGEVADRLSEVASQPFSREAICVLQCFSLRQQLPTEKHRFESILRDLSRERDIWRLGLEWPEVEHTKLVLDHYQAGERMTSELVATCRADGSAMQFRRMDN